MQQVAAVGAVASMSLSDVDFSDTGKKEGSQFNMMSMVTAGVTSGATILWIFACVLNSGVSAVVATIVNICVAPVVVLQRYQLNRMSTFREVHNALREDVSRFALENDDLEMNTDSLTEKANKVKKAEAHLSDIATSQGSNITDLMNLIKENGAIQVEMEELVKNQIMEQVMGILMTVDRDQNFNLDDNEISMLFMRLRSVQGVENIDEDKLRDCLQANRGLHGLMALFREMGNNSEKLKMITVSSRRLLQ